MVEFLPTLPWIILFAPLVSTALICCFAMRSARVSAGLSLGGILASLAGSAGLFAFHAQNTLLPAESSVRWLEVFGLKVEFGFLIDPLSILMLLIVTGVGSCIFFYSTGYMKGDPSTPRYFASLSLFAFSMIGIVLSNNFLMLFVFWELVAVSSYLLIGFWFEKPSAADAGNKAFIVNRVADFGFLIGILTVWGFSGIGGAERTFVFSDLEHILPQAAAAGLLDPRVLQAMALLIFCGVLGKSAQFPLYIWLPDAMEGPTPVSALIHAATMVAAGVYLLARSFFLIESSPESLSLIAHIGAVTAFLAAFLAVAQNDIKKILAYSTISQLGYMVLALGLGGATPAVYHLTTHAFFKALLFLGAGAMIHGLHTQDIWEMGGLLKRMPATAWTFLIGTLALCGIFPFAGFFSKDEILAVAYGQNRALFVLAELTAFLTAFYMSRAVWVAVLGPRRANPHLRGHEHVHDAPPVMKFPLIVLAALSLAGGFLGIPAFLMRGGEHASHAHFNWTVALISTASALGGIAVGTALYAKLRSKEDPAVKLLGVLHPLLARKYFLDDVFSALAAFFNRIVAGLLLGFDTRVVIERGVNGTARLTALAGSALRRAQTGNLQTYATVIGFGAAGLAFWMLFFKA